MKRLIAVLLVMGVIMTAFAASGSAGRLNITGSSTTGSSTTAADTEVVLNLSQNAGIVWFSAGENQNVSTYYLTLPEITSLNQSNSETQNWCATGNNLKLNWNIVSCNSVKIELSIDGKLKGQSSQDNTIGWKLSFKTTSYSGNTGTPNGTPTEICAGYPDQTDALTATAITKNKTVYGSRGSLAIDEIITENTYGKNVDIYKATLTAKISTTD